MDGQFVYGFVTSSLQYLFLLLLMDSVYIWISPEFTLNGRRQLSKELFHLDIVDDHLVIFYQKEEPFYMHIWSSFGNWMESSGMSNKLESHVFEQGNSMEDIQFFNPVLNIIRLTWTFILALYMYYTLYLNSLRLINISMVKIIICPVFESITDHIQNFLIKIRVNYISFITHTYSFIYFFIW